MAKWAGWVDWLAGWLVWNVTAGATRPAIESASDFLLLLANDPIYGPHSGQRSESFRLFGRVAHGHKNTRTHTHSLVSAIRTWINFGFHFLMSLPNYKRSVENSETSDKANQIDGKLEEIRLAIGNYTEDVGLWLCVSWIGAEVVQSGSWSLIEIVLLTKTQTWLPFLPFEKL